MSWFARLRRPSLARRIYIFGVVQIAVVLAGFATLTYLDRPASPAEHHAQERRLVAFVTANPDDDAAILAALTTARDATGLHASVEDPSGQVLASSVPADAAPCFAQGPPPRGHRPPPKHLQPPPGHRHGKGKAPPPGSGKAPHRDMKHPPPPRDGEPAVCYAMSVSFGEDGMGRIEFRRTRAAPTSPFAPPVLILVLIVVTATSLSLARSLSRPLARLSDSARALGQGDLGARARLQRPDEIGDVAQAFDQMAERLADLVRAERELVANLSHELRTPLARIRVALDIANEGDAEAARESLRDIAEDLEELERLIEDVLAAARLELNADAPHGVPPLRKTSAPPSALVEHAAARFKDAHPQRPLQVDCEDVPHALECDEVLLRRALDNLLENAHKYTPAPTSPVMLTLRDAESAAEFEVRDHGTGISDADLEKVFRPFFRVEGSRSRQTGGLGLGLSLAKRIAEAHGGSLSLTSEPGVGTRAVIRVPYPPRL